MRDLCEDLHFELLFTDSVKDNRKNLCTNTTSSNSHTENVRTCGTRQKTGDNTDKDRCYRDSVRTKNVCYSDKLEL